MSNNNTSIHDFDFSFICNYFKLLKRQGPGSPEATRKAVSFINELTDDAKIADIGCGTEVINSVVTDSKTDDGHRPLSRFYRNIQ